MAFSLSEMTAFKPLKKLNVSLIDISETATIDWPLMVIESASFLSLAPYIRYMFHSACIFQFVILETPNR